MTDGLFYPPGSTGPVTIAGQPIEVVDVAGGAAVGEVAATDVAIDLAPANPTRQGLLVWNDSPFELAIAYGTGADPRGVFTVLVPPRAVWVMSAPIYRGLVSGAWRSPDPIIARANGEPSVSGSAFVTDLSQ
jgi:hypothetical protein